jgi:hypothetical protein
MQVGTQSTEQFLPQTLVLEYIRTKKKPADTKLKHKKSSAKPAYK